MDVGPLLGMHQEELDEQAQELLEAEVGRMKVSGIEITQTHRRTGKADEEIKFKVDLIVMGGRDLGGARRFRAGIIAS